MTIPAVKTAKALDEAHVIDTLKLAFVADPAARWLLDDQQKYLTHFSTFAKAFGGKAFIHGSAYYVEDYSGAALWLPPDVHPDVDTLVTLMETVGSAGARKDGPSVFERMGSYHPSEPHWYLPLLGVNPLKHGKGLGSALMQYATAQFDRDGQIAYLESSNPRNIPFYERHGFELLGTIQVGTSPPIFPMLRKSQK